MTRRPEGNIIEDTQGIARLAGSPELQQIQKINPGAALQIDEDGKVNIIFPPAAQEEEGSGVWAHVYLLDQLKDKQDTDKYLGESY